jgi:ATP-dependent Clp protease protease subunit
MNFYNRLIDRELLINEIVSNKLIEYAQYILDWNRADKDIPIEERQKIKIYINTDGGEISAMYTFIDIIQLSKTPCVTICMGKGYSAGALIFTATPVESRYMLPHSYVMYHKGYSGITADAQKIVDYGDFLKKSIDKFRNYILSSTKIPSKKYKQMSEKDWYLDANDCLKYGICGHIITDIDELLSL